MTSKAPSDVGFAASIALLVTTGYFLYRHVGHYASSVWVYAALVFASAAVMSRRTQPWRFPRLVPVALSAVTAVFCVAMCLRSRLAYPSEGVWLDILSMVLVAAAASACLAVCANVALARSADVSERWNRIAFLASGSAACLLVVAHLIVPAVSPNPAIDVWVNNTAAVDHLLRGQNPYSKQYVDIYEGRYSYGTGYAYFPGLLLALIPFRLLGDIRHATIVCQLVIVGCALMLSARADSSVRRSLPMLWLSFPVTLFVMEQAWTDIFLVALFAGSLVAIDRKWLRTAGILIGFMVTVKQYAFVMSVMVVLHVLRRHGRRSAVTTAGWAAITFLSVMLPFVLADPGAFYRMTVTSHGGQLIRADSFNVTALIANTTGVIVPMFVQAILALVGLGIGAWRALTSRNPHVGDVALAAWFGLACAFLFGKWAFCNYHYLLAGCGYLYLASHAETTSPPRR